MKADIFNRIGTKSNTLMNSIIVVFVYSIKIILLIQISIKSSCKLPSKVWLYQIEYNYITTDFQTKQNVSNKNRLTLNFITYSIIQWP